MKPTGHTRLLVSAAVWACVFFLLSNKGSASSFPNRKATDSPCSLKAVDTDDLMDRNCQIESVHGTDSEERLLMRFGETNCTVKLKNCAPGVCYSIIDLTSRLPQDKIPRRQPSSFFSSISLVGASRISHTSKGIAFQSEEEEVVLNYSTHTCSDFYWYHGKETRQLCNAPYAAIVAVEAATPYSLSCRAS